MCRRTQFLAFKEPYHIEEIHVNTQLQHSVSVKDLCQTVEGDKDQVRAQDPKRMGWKSPDGPE